MNKDIEQLLNDGKLEEAFDVLKKELDKPLSPKDTGRIYTELMSAYLEVSNNINKEHEKELREISQVLRDIKSKEDELKRDGLISNL
jgi:Skp family chaperone for outer membrane proteins